MIRIFSLLFLSFFMAACSSKSLSPTSVSKEFWDAQRDNRIEAAKKLTVKEDAAKTRLYKKIEIKTAEFGKAKERENRATVPTTLYLKSANDISEVSFTTVLNQTDKGWRINMSETKRNLYFAISKQVAGNLGAIFKESLGGVDNIKTIFGEFIESFKDIIENKNIK